MKMQYLFREVQCFYYSLKIKQIPELCVFKFHFTIKLVYVYRITTSTANTGNNLYIFKLLKIVLSRKFDMQY